MGEIKTKYRVLCYTRVSTKHDEQADSIDNQKTLMKKYLERHPEMELAEPIDKYSETISAKSDERPAFQEMMARIDKGGIDYILIKDMKRLSRSVETTCMIFSKMQDCRFSIITLAPERIIDKDAYYELESRTLLGIESLFAENLVLQQSRYGKTVHKMRCENKVLSRKDVTFGYRWNNETKSIEINEEEAKIIRDIYDRFVYGYEGVYEIRKYLSSLGYDRSSPTVTKWLKEEKYIGLWSINRIGSQLGVGTGRKTKRIKLPKEEWVYIERPDLAIVDKEIFDLAQKIRESRAHIYNPGINNKICKEHFTGKHLFSGKIFCKECGCSYVHDYANRANTIGIYRDSFKLHSHNALAKCKNQKYARVYEEDMKEVVKRSIQAVSGNVGKAAIDMIYDVIKDVVTTNHDPDNEVMMLRNEIIKLSKKADRITDAFIDASSDMRASLNKKLDDIKATIMEKKTRINILTNTTDTAHEISSRLNAIRAELDLWANLGTDFELNRELVKLIIHKMTINMYGTVVVSLNATQKKEYFYLDPVHRNLDNSNSNKGIARLLDKDQYIKMLLEELNKSVKETNDLRQFKLLNFEFKTSNEEKRLQNKEPQVFYVEAQVVSERKE